MAEKKNLWRSVSRRKARCHALSKGARNFFLITRIELGTSKRCTIKKLMRSNAHIATLHDSQKVILTDIFSKLILVRMFCLPSLGVQRKSNLLQWVVLGIFWTAGTVFTCRALFSQRTDSLFYHTLSPFLLCSSCFTSSLRRRQTGRLFILFLLLTLLVAWNYGTRT